MTGRDDNEKKAVEAFAKVWWQMDAPVITEGNFRLIADGLRAASSLSAPPAPARDEEIERLKAELADAHAALDKDEIAHGLTSNGNLWRFWAEKARAATLKLAAEAEAVSINRRVKFLLEDCASYIDTLHRKLNTKPLEIGIDTAILRDAAALQSERAGSGDAVRVKLGDMPSYGVCTGNDMLRAVADAIFGDRDISLLRDIDDSRPIGHQFVPNVNFNSLNRIISAFIAGSALTVDADRPAIPSIVGEWEVTQAQLHSACLSFRHDFGLLDEGLKASVMFVAREWLSAWGKALRSNRPATGKEGELIRAGAAMACVCFNLSQVGSIPDEARKALKDAQVEWDAARTATASKMEVVRLEGELIRELPDRATEGE